jgi:hypothetical protein
MRSTMVPRALGVLTAAYGAYTLARPQSLARVAGLVTPERPPSRATRNLGWAIGMRDLVSGAAMILAPPGNPLRAALAVRVACDAGDAVGFGVAVPRSSRAKVIAVAAGWGLICATALAYTGRDA